MSQFGNLKISKFNERRQNRRILNITDDNPMRQTILYFLTVILCLTIYSCTDETAYPEGKEGTLTVTLHLPADMKSSGIRTRSMAADGGITKIDILAFSQSGSQYTFAYRAGTTFTTENGTVTATIRNIQELAVDQRFLILVNMSNDDIAAAGIAFGDELEVARKKLVVTNDAEWPANIGASQDSRDIPMYALTDAMNVRGISSLGSYNVVRMLARIDVKNSAANFQLEEAYLFNRRNKGYAGYKESNWDNNNEVVATAEVPEGTTRTKLPTQAYLADGSYRIVNEIFSFESKGSPIEKKNATAIVVGGYYNGASTLTYYRIDISETDEQGKPRPDTYIDIKRNHLYDIDIQSVAAEGTYTAEDAFDGAVFINATIKEYNLANQDIHFDGQHEFTIDKPELEFDEYPGSMQQIKVTTTNPSGITPLTDASISYVDDAGWLSITPSGEEGVWNLTVTENGESSRREASFYVNVANFNYKVKVRQKGAPNSYILYTGETVDIPVHKAYYAWRNDNALNTTLSGAVSTRVLWQDQPNGGAVSGATLLAGYQGEDSRIHVQAGGQEGNAVVVMEIDGVIRWSWHIWVCDPANDPRKVGLHGSPNSNFTFMGRNLGAINNEKGDINSHGFLYQWGRSNPFPGAATTTLPDHSNNSKTIYDGTSSTILTEGSLNGGTGVRSILVSEYNNLPNAVSNPLIIYLLREASYDYWYTNDPANIKDDFWRRSNGKKGTFDPCPEGWRVPTPVNTTQSPWQGLPVVPFTTGEGADWTGWGYYPATGYRHPVFGDFVNVGKTVNSVTSNRFSTRLSPNFYLLNANTSSVSSLDRAGRQLRAHAFPVRCIKE